MKIRSSTSLNAMLAVFLVTALFCTSTTTISRSGNEEAGADGYDPWLDYNDDGGIDYKDLFMLARAYGTSGTPINKTALLLELQTRVQALEDRLAALEAPGSVTTEKIADGAVTNTKLAPFAIPLNFVDSDLSASTTSTTFVDMPDMVATITIDRTSILFILFSANAWNTETFSSVLARALVDGISAKPAWVWLTENRESRLGIMANAFNFYAIVPSGAHTVKIQWRVTRGTAEALMRSLVVIALPA